jgi:DNA-binding HxlR family transcriptional regulator
MSYDRRSAELALTFSSEVEESRELTFYLPRLNDYAKRCGAALDELVKAVSSVNLSDSREAEEWANVRDRQLAEAIKAKPDLSKYSETPSVALFAFHTRLQLDEAPFLGALGKSNVGDEIDRIAAVARNLEQKTADLEKIWKETVDRDGEFDRQAEATAQEIAKIVDEAIETAAANHRTLLESFAELTKINDKIPEGAQDLSDLLPGLFGLAAKALLKVLANSTYFWAKMQERLIEREGKLKETFGKEANLLLVFSETRKEVEEFVKTTNLDQAKAALDQAEDELDALVAAMKTSGQKDDLGRFKQQVLDALERVLDEAEKRHDQFVSKHRNKFFGPLSSQVVDELIESSRWNGLARAIDSRTLHDRLAELHSKNLFSVNVGKLRPEVREYIEKEAKRGFDEAMKAILDIDRKITSQSPERQIEEQRKQLETRLR